jgi:hypothetical protein
MEPSLSAIPIEWGVATRSLAAGAPSGDGYLVKPVPRGMLIAVVDGLGHGPQAAAASETALATLERHAAEPPAVLLGRCHENLRPTRGAVLSLARIDESARTLTWLGVGNVEGVLLRADRAANPPLERLAPRPGVLGRQLPALGSATLPFKAGDTLILATDGIPAGFEDHLTVSPPRRLADDILALHGSSTDDALVLVACLRGGLAP